MQSNKELISLYFCLISHHDLRFTINLSPAWVPGVSAIVILTSLPNTLDRHPWVNKLMSEPSEMKEVKERGSVHRDNACYFVRWKRWHTAGMSIQIKTKLLCKHNFIGRCQTSGCWHWSLHRKKKYNAHYSSLWDDNLGLSNVGKSPCPLEIIFKQRRTHSEQYVECVNAGGEQVCLTDLNYRWCQHNRGNEGFNRVRRWCIVLCVIWV